MSLPIPYKHFEGFFDLVPENANKNTVSRIRKFQSWLKDNNQPWHEPDLAAYRDHLLTYLKPSSVKAHLGTIRARIEFVRTSNEFRDALEIGITNAFERANQEYHPADVQALVERKLNRLQTAIDPKRSQVREEEHQDLPDSTHLRLTADQANALIASPGLDTLRGLRDTAIIGLMLTTGIRAAEAAAVEVPDLVQTYGGDLALHVRKGKGGKSRVIVYGGNDWVLIILDHWLKAAGIHEGPVFRGFYNHSKRIRKTQITTRGIELILKRYPISINGKMCNVAAHDLRRTYAKLNYLAGMDPLSLQQNLGHKRSETTTGYIGTLDASKRRPAAVFHINLNGIMKSR